MKNCLPPAPIFWDNVPKHEIEALVRCLLPDIRAYFESEEGQREFSEWKAQQARKKKHKQA